MTQGRLDRRVRRGSILQYVVGVAGQLTDATLKTLTTAVRTYLGTA